MALGAELGGLRDGSCYYLNLAGWPIVQQVLGEPVQACAGYAGFVSQRGRAECGFRWRPDKWRDLIDADTARHLTPLQDLHVWLETKRHVIDLSPAIASATRRTSGRRWCTGPSWSCRVIRARPAAGARCCCGAAALEALPRSWCPCWIRCSNPWPARQQPC
jgi:hypothetical protein